VSYKYKLFYRLLNDEDPLHKNAVGYFRYFLENDIILKVSTISVVEYCALGRLEDLPLKNVQIIQFERSKENGIICPYNFRRK